jgi:hypothetical protein
MRDSSFFVVSAAGSFGAPQDRLLPDMKSFKLIQNFEMRV